MAAAYDVTSGKIRIIIADNGVADHKYPFGVLIQCPDPSPIEPTQTLAVSIDDLKDLQLLLKQLEIFEKI